MKLKLFITGRIIQAPLTEVFSSFLKCLSDPKMQSDPTKGGGPLTVLGQDVVFQTIGKARNYQAGSFEKHEWPHQIVVSTNAVVFGYYANSAAIKGMRTGDPYLGRMDVARARGVADEVYYRTAKATGMGVTHAPGKSDDLVQQETILWGSLYAALGVMPNHLISSSRNCVGYLFHADQFFKNRTLSPRYAKLQSLHNATMKVMPNISAWAASMGIKAIHNMVMVDSYFDGRQILHKNRESSDQ
jgi:hypothetical protein